MLAGVSVGVVTSRVGTHRLGLATRKEAAGMSEQREMQAAAVRTMLDAIEDVAGAKGKDMVLRHANLGEYIEDPPPLDTNVLLPTDHYRAICRALMEVFGKGSRVMLIYAGERALARMLEAIPGAFGSAMKLVPGGLRKRAALKIAAMQTESLTGVPPKVEYHKDTVVYRYYNCPFCEGYESDEPICFFDLGVLKAFVEWATGKPHTVTEIECSAMGAEACVYEIVEA
jgi:predicted hydrocarbon binding protein